MRLRVLAITPLIAAALLGIVTPPAHAQQSSTPRGPFPFVETRFGTPQQAAFGVGLLIPLRELVQEDGLVGGPGVEIQASAGRGGFRVAGGPLGLALPLWQDLLFTATRTTDTPRGATPGSTYLGVEGGLGFPVGCVGRRPLVLKVNLGASHRVTGPVGPNRTIYSWNIGAVVPFRWR